nr:MAG TPA: hypothetical protein [Caudoviricetes sp.]
MGVRGRTAPERTNTAENNENYINNYEKRILCAPARSFVSSFAIVDGNCNNGLLCGGAVNLNNAVSNSNWNISARSFL